MESRALHTTSTIRTRWPRLLVKPGTAIATYESDRNH